MIQISFLFLPSKNRKEDKEQRRKRKERKKDNSLKKEILGITPVKDEIMNYEK